MKILQVIPFFTPKRGGSVMVPYHITQELIKRGHSVTIICSDFEFDKEFADSIKQKGANVISFKKLFSLGLFIYTPDMSTWLKENIYMFDIVHLHNFRNFQNVLATKTSINNRIPYILQAHGDIPYFEKKFLKWIFDIIWGKKILNNLALAFALSNSEVEHYSKKGILKNKIKIIPNGIESSFFLNLPKQNLFRKKYSIDLKNKIILYIGRLHKSKGLDILIDAYNELSKKNSDIVLVLIGPDDNFLFSVEHKIRKGILENKIFHLGFVDDQEKRSAMVDADVFVTPTFFGFPVTFLESCGCGLPIITTNKYDTLDWIQKKVGLVVQYNKEEVSTAILSIINNSQIKTYFSENGKSIVNDNFIWEKVCQKIENEYLVIKKRSFK